MRHKVKKTKLGRRNRDHTRLLLGNLATSLILHEKIKTTRAKAKALQPVIDNLIKTAKRENKVLAIREVNRVLHNELSAKKLIEEFPKRFENRNSGYTRVTNIGFRAGDNAPYVQIEFVK